MDALSIQHMHTRCRLPAGAGAGLRARLAAVRADLLGGALEAALERAGIGPDEDVCVRRLHVPVTLRGLARATRGDADLAADWAAALATAMVGSLELGGADVARYATRMQAWADCAAGVARGDLGRAWAWRRLGLWRGDDDLSPSEAAAELAQGLVCAPETVVPVLSSLARRGLLTAMARRLDAAAWMLLAAAALDAHGASRELLEPAVAADMQTPSVPTRVPAVAPPPARRPRAATDADPSVAPPAALARLAAGSPLLALSAAAGPDTAWPIAVLMLLAADPGLGHRPAAQARRQLEPLAAALHALGRPGARATDRADASGATESAPPALVQRPVDGAKQPRELERATDTPAEPSRRTFDQRRPAPERDQADATGESTPDRGSNDVRAPYDSEPRAPAKPESLEDPAGPALRAYGRTASGGLLLLLNLVEPAGLLSAEAVLPAERTLRWTLHQLAQTLAPVSADDPAALAFAGLGPGSRPPSDGLPPPDEADSAAIAGLRARLVVLLQSVLAVGSEHPEALLARVCRRPAEIIADPGWIEVRFPMERLSTEIRRCGLDLNPDWLPWLGAVVRFRYV